VTLWYEVASESPYWMMRPYDLGGKSNPDTPMEQAERTGFVLAAIVETILFIVSILG
jgi:hypothetical protein